MPTKKEREAAGQQALSEMAPPTHEKVKELEAELEATRAQLLEVQAQVPPDVLPRYLIDRDCYIGSARIDVPDGATREIDTIEEPGSYMKPLNDEALCVLQALHDHQTELYKEGKRKEPNWDRPTELYDGKQAAVAKRKESTKRKTRVRDWMASKGLGKVREPSEKEKSLAAKAAAAKAGLEGGTEGDRASDASAG